MPKEDTQFKPGQSGNPGGRPKGIARKAREHGDKALEVLAAALEDPDSKVRITAAKELLDRGYGKAVAMTADVTSKLDEMDDDFLDDAIAVLGAEINAAAEAARREKETTRH